MAGRKATIAATGILVLLLITAGCVSPTPAAAVPAASPLMHAEDVLHESASAENTGISSAFRALQFDMC